MSAARRGARREFYSIGEVCEMLDLKPHVLRYWETQFDHLSPSKNRAGTRVYRPRDLETIALIRRLLHEQRFTIDGARQQLAAMDEKGSVPEHSARALEASLVASLRAELEGLLDLLGPDSD